VTRAKKNVKNTVFEVHVSVNNSRNVSILFEQPTERSLKGIVLLYMRCYTLAISKEVKMSDQPNYLKGVLLSLLAVPVAMVLWVIIWRMGYVASLVAFALAWLVLWLYEKGTGVKPDKRSAPYLVAIIVLGVVLSFTAGVVSDGHDFYTSSDGGSLSSMDAIGSAIGQLGNGELWATYTNNALMALLFGALGAGWVIYALFKGEKSDVVRKETKSD